jgi:hypothetical protein
MIERLVGWRAMPPDGIGRLSKAANRFMNCRVTPLEPAGSVAGNAAMVDGFGRLN